MSYDDLSNPGVKEFRDAFATYEPDAPLHEWSLEGWMAGKQLVDALNSMGAAPTRVGLESWLNGLEKYTNGGLSVPLDYKVKDLPNMQFATGDCTAIAQWQDDQHGWVQRTAPYQCYDNTTFEFSTKASDRGD